MARASPSDVAGGDALGEVAVCAEGQDAGVSAWERQGHLVLGGRQRGPAVPRQRGRGGRGYGQGRGRGWRKTNKTKPKHISRLHSGDLVQFQCNPNGDE